MFLLHTFPFHINKQRRRTNSLSVNSNKTKLVLLDIQIIHLQL